MNVKEISKEIFSGTFSRKKHRENYRDVKFNREIDIFSDYLMQLPVAKVVTIPAVIIIFILYILLMCARHPMDILRDLVSIMKLSCKKIKQKVGIPTKN